MSPGIGCPPHPEPRCCRHVVEDAGGGGRCTGIGRVTARRVEKLARGQRIKHVVRLAPPRALSGIEIRHLLVDKSHDAGKRGRGSGGAADEVNEKLALVVWFTGAFQTEEIRVMARRRQGNVRHVAHKVVRNSGDYGLPRRFWNTRRCAALSVSQVSSASSAAAGPQTEGGAAFVP